MKGILKGILTVCMAAVLLFPVRAAATEVGEPGDNIASGTVEGITWVIDAEGKLTITGTGDLPEEYRGGHFVEESFWDYYYEVYYSNMPWADYTEQIISAKIDVKEMTDASSLFCGCDHLVSVDLSGFDTSQVTDMSYMFYNCNSQGLTSIDVSGFDTSQVTDMSFMFFGCLCLESIDLSHFNTSQVTDMDSMFLGCGSLTSLDLSTFDTSQVTNMGGMFTDCSILTSVDVSTFDTSQVTDMSYMFGHCYGLTSLNVSDFKTSQVTDMSQMFNSCRALTNLDVSGFETSQVTDMSYMFYDCSGLTSLDVSGFETSQVTDMSYMFYDCSSLTSLDLSSFDVSQVTVADDVFSGCNKLNTIDTPYNVHFSGDLPVVEGLLPWHMPDGTVVTSLPKNLDHSVLLWRNPEITTTTADLNMEDVIRIQYVPYSYTIETSNQDQENTVTFSIEEGTLPEGLEIYPATGEIYGVPMEVGEFPLTIKATFSDKQYQPAYAEIMLTVLENTAENIAKATEPGYEITEKVAEELTLEDLSADGAQTLVSQGEFGQFEDVYLDGRKLIRDEEYTAVEGSTRITIKNQTLGDAGVGTHTLGIEFRSDEGILKRAAQNYTVSRTSTGSGSTGQPGGSGETEQQPGNKPGSGETEQQPGNKPGSGETEQQPGNESGSGGSGNQSGSQSGATTSNGNSSSGGNSNNSASTQATAAETQMTEVIYTVQSGDNLWKIASKYRKQGVTWQKIYADNAAVIKNPGMIFAGQQLRICFAVTEGTETSAAGTLGTYSEKYSVRQGDTLWGIAVMTYGDGRFWTRIYEANRDVLENPDRLRIGQILVLGQ